eukprot:COSAG04_NODE_1230_length_7679_cov_1.728232_4_plen_81_part_00
MPHLRPLRDSSFIIDISYTFALSHDGRTERMDVPHGWPQAPMGAGVAPSPYGFNGGAPLYGADPRSMMPGAPMNACESTV